MFYSVYAKPNEHKRYRIVEFAEDGLYIVNRIINGSVFNDKQLDNLKDHLKRIHLDSQISFKIKSKTGRTIWSI